MSLTFQGLGWKTILRKKRYSYFFTIAKELIIGNGLKESNNVYSYLAQHEGRNVLLIYLDGQERGVPKKLLKATPLV